MNADQTYSNLQQTTKHILGKAAHPPSRTSPLVCASEKAVSGCSVILHCQKYHDRQLKAVT